MPRRLHVFSGPTLSASAVREVVPDAVVHPPVAAGDLSRLALTPGDVVVIVDGAMTAGTTVRHKEILSLVGAGVEVWGAGALGALRAAELHAHGVRAHGRVARLFIRGVLDGDDEVAGDGGVALVDLRATCRAACRAGVLHRADAWRIVAAAQALRPSRRSWEAISTAALDAGVGADTAAWLHDRASRTTVSLTRDDAISCLRTVQHRRGLPPRPQRAPTPVLTAFAQAWREEAAGAELPGAGFVGDLAVLTLCRLLAVDFPVLQRRVALRTLAALAAPTPRTGEREGQVMIREFADEQGLTADSLPLWLAERGLRRDELLAQLRREHSVALLAEAVGINLANEARVDEMLAEVVAEHARRRGLVSLGAGQSWERSWLSNTEIDSLSAEEKIARLAARSFHSMPGVVWRQPLLEELKLNGVFTVAREAVVQARQYVAADPEPEAGDEAVVAWFVQRWEAHDRFDLALLDRGFADLDTFLPRARPFHAFDRDTTAYRDLRCLGLRAALAP
jgi:hypothetical protein